MASTVDATAGSGALRDARRALERIGATVCGWNGTAPAEAGLFVDRVCRYVDALPRASQLAVAAQVALLDQGARLYPPARGRRLATVDPDVAARYLSLALGGRLPGTVGATRSLTQLLTLCWFDLPSVREPLGYHPDPHIARVARRRLERHGEDIAAVERKVTGGSASLDTPHGGSTPARGGVVSCDVVVVGSGAGGATTAAELAGGGIDVLLVEEGSHHPTESFTTDVVRAFGTLYRAGGAQMIVGRPPVTFLEGRCVGGSTVVNGGMCWRTPAAVLDRWEHEESVAEVGRQAMDRHFRAVEERLSIGPQAPESIGRDSELLEHGAHRLGWAVARSRRNQLHCGGCDNCLAGCPTGAKRSMLVTNVPRALQRGARLIHGCRIDRITREGKQVTGVEGTVVESGERLRIRARVVVAACGGLQTPALLARSGFRSPSGQLGRNLALHPSATLVAIFDEPIDGWQGVHQAFQVTEFLREGVLVTASSLPPALIAASLQVRGPALAELMADYRRMVVAGCLVEDTASGRVRALPGGGAAAAYTITDEDARRIVRGITLAAEAMFAAGARRVLLPLLGWPQPLGADAARRVLAGPIPRKALQLFTVHAMGTARMSDDRLRGVVSSYGEFHGAAGLFVADASILPGPVGVNPMETIVALAMRNSERLTEERRRHGI